MPMYEYRCTVCGYEFEKMVHVGDANPPCLRDTEYEDENGKHNGVCGGETEKLISRSTFHLKGGGWASDGYCSASASSSSKS